MYEYGGLDSTVLEGDFWSPGHKCSELALSFCIDQSNYTRPDVYMIESKILLIATCIKETEDKKFRSGNFK